MEASTLREQDEIMKEAFELKKELERISTQFCTNNHEACSVEITVKNVFDCIDRDGGCNLACPHTTRLIILHPHTENECVYVDKKYELDADEVIKRALRFLKSHQDTSDLDGLYEYFDTIRRNTDLVVGSKQRPYKTQAASEKGKRIILEQAIYLQHNEWIQTLYSEDVESIKYKLALVSLKNWITQEAQKIKTEVQRKMNQIFLELQESY